jgi:hypothetical protein
MGIFIDGGSVGTEGAGSENGLVIERSTTKYRAEIIITHALTGLKRELSYSRRSVIIVHDGRGDGHGDIFRGAREGITFFSRDSHIGHVGEFAVVTLEDECGDNEEGQCTNDRTERERGEYK